MPSHLPAQALHLTDLLDNPIKAAERGMTVRMALNCSFPEDLNVGNYLVARKDTGLHHVTKEVIAKVELRPESFTKDTVISPGYRFILERGFSRSEATIDDLRDVLASEESEPSKPKYILIGKTHTGVNEFTCKFIFSEPISCLSHGCTFLLRDQETNSSVGVGKVTKLKPYKLDPAEIRKDYQSSQLHKKLQQTLKKLKLIRISIDQSD